MLRSCVRCGHDNATATGSDSEACPQCGAIYTKAKPRTSGTPSGFGASSSFPSDTRRRSLPEVSEYARAMRAGTLYPTFRAVTNAAHLVALVFAALLAAAGVFATVKDSPSAGAVGIVLAVLVVVVSKVLREGSHMLADMADAAVRTAARGGE